MRKHQRNPNRGTLKIPKQSSEKCQDREDEGRPRLEQTKESRWLKAVRSNPHADGQPLVDEGAEAMQSPLRDLSLQPVVKITQQTAGRRVSWTKGLEQLDTYMQKGASNTDLTTHINMNLKQMKEQKL